MDYDPCTEVLQNKVSILQISSNDFYAGFIFTGLGHSKSRETDPHETGQDLYMHAENTVLKC
jgi:hypothetical protein